MHTTGGHVPAIPAPASDSLANSSLNVPRTRARAKTQGPADADPEKIFVFGGNTQAPQNEQLLHPRDAPSTSGGTNLATSLLRRFSSKRKPSRDTSNPTTTAQQSQSQSHPSNTRHQQNFSQPANVYSPGASLDSPFVQPTLQTDASDHKLYRKPVDSGVNENVLSQQLGRSVSSRPPPGKLDPNGSDPERLTPQLSNSKRYHPSARAKSLGHVRGDAAAKQMLARQREEILSHQVPGLPSNYESADITDEFFDPPFENRGGSSSTSSQVAQGSKNTFGDPQASHTPHPDVTVGMPSIEFPKQVFLKGFFSVQSTSTKPLGYIRSDIIRVLNHLGVEYKEIKGGFACMHRPSIRTSDEDPFAGSGSNIPSNTHQSHLSPPASPIPVNTGGTEQRGHWRKLSFGSGFFGNSRRRQQTGSSGNIVDYSDISTDSVGGPNSGYNIMSSVTAPSNSAGNSDMLGHPKSTAAAAVRTPLQFEIWIVRVPLLSLHGVQFKKLRGNSWLYKSLASKILAELRL